MEISGGVLLELGVVKHHQTAESKSVLVEESFREGVEQFVLG